MLQHGVIADGRSRFWWVKESACFAFVRNPCFILVEVAGSLQRLILALQWQSTLHQTHLPLRALRHHFVGLRT